MNCKKAQGLLGRYADKELIAEEARCSLEEHLGSCKHCRGELDSLLCIKTFITQKERIGFDPSFIWRLQEKLQSASSAQAPGWLFDMGTRARRLIPVPIITAMLLAVVLSRLPEPRKDAGLFINPLAGLEQIDPVVLLSYEILNNKG